MSNSQDRYNLCYNGRVIYKDLSFDDCSDIIQDLSEQFYSGEDINPELIELEPLFD
jgi:hypothetical protein